MPDTATAQEPSALTVSSVPTTETDAIVTLEILQEIFRNYDGALKVLDFKPEFGTKPGDNFMSIMLAVDVSLKRKSKSGDQVEKMSIMFKAIPRNQVILDILKEWKAFRKETMMYNEILPFLIGGTNFTSIPKCLAAFYDGKDNGYIVMENLRVQGFQMLPKHQWLDMAHATLLVKELAKFHALSFVKWNGDGHAILAAFPDIAEAQWLHPDSVTSMTKLCVGNTFTDLKKLLLTENLIEEGNLVMDHKEDLLSRMHDLTSVSDKFPNVITHGDLWSNNMLFRYDDAGLVNEVKLVDFQISKVGSRMLDLSYLIYTSLQVPVLSTSIPELLRIYHRTFESFLTTDLKLSYPVKFGNQELTWEFFLEEWNAYKYYGITMALIYMPCMCANPENVPDMEAIDLNDLSDKEDSKFSNLMNAEYTLPRLQNLVKFHLPA